MFRTPSGTCPANTEVHLRFKESTYTLADLSLTMTVDYPTNKIWTTLVTKRAYFGGALVLNHTLKKVGSRYQLKIMVTREAEADKDFMAAFAAAGIPTILIDNIEPTRKGKVNKAFWQKLAPWAMTEYEVGALSRHSYQVKYTQKFTLVKRYQTNH